MTRVNSCPSCKQLPLGGCKDNLFTHKGSYYFCPQYLAFTNGTTTRLREDTEEETKLKPVSKISSDDDGSGSRD